MTKRYYVGCNEGARVVFRNAGEPTFRTHGTIYNAVIGPFRSKAGAVFMATYGQANPHCRNVGEAERLARKYRDEAMAFDAGVRRGARLYHQTR